MPTVEIENRSLYYLDQGTGQAIVLLHANPGDSRDFNGIIPTLSKNHRVIALDWCGYGQSAPITPPTASSAMYFYQVLIKFLDKIELPAAIFLGNSIGGYAASCLAIKQPNRVKGLILVAPGGFTQHNLFTRLFCRLQASPLAIPPGIMASLYLNSRNEIVKEMLRRAKNEQSLPIAKVINRSVWSSFLNPEHNLIDDAKHITQPTLLFFGKRDPLIPVSKDGRVAATTISQAKFYALNTGHAPFAEDPVEFLQIIIPFLDAIEMG
jgi:pimeloyl-ACP methyl ester carboxylesterase